jgi:predicted MFS family arabinose efflux permease
VEYFYSSSDFIERAILETARQKQAGCVHGFFGGRAAAPFQGERATHGTAGEYRAPVLATIFFPLAVGYSLSYLFRTINGPLADELITRFRLDAASLGVLTSVYFLAFACSAIPIGVALDRFGPRRVQGSLMIVAAIGAAVFACAPGITWLIVGRALIGLGVAGGLMAGLKAHATWVSSRYLPLANGGLVMFGGLGAIAATTPVSLVDAAIGWRGTFAVLALLSALIATAIFTLLPSSPKPAERMNWRHALDGFVGTFSDRRFLRMAPLSASVVGTAFAIHGLWAARWLTDIDGLGADSVLLGLFALGVGLTIGALLIGAVSVWLRGAGVRENTIFVGFCLIFIALQLVLRLNIAVPTILLWGAFGGFGGMTVLSYSILDGMFDPSVVGRANSALNVLHLTTAWAVQAGMGIIIAKWPADALGHYPIAAYRAALLLPLTLQVGGLIWFLASSRFGASLPVLSPVAKAVMPRVPE